ncbi:MAG: ABC transporter [Flavobacteriaceae bacterium]|nr:MAG: ABC transporter [Flavobacteriaceae bacterium]
MKQFVQLIKVEFSRIFSNNVLIAIFFGAPLLYGVLFGYVYKQAKVLDLPIVLIDQDMSPISDKITDALHDNETLKIVEFKAGTENIAALMPSKGYAAVITIPSNFEADLLQKRYPEVRIDLNMSNILNANFASKSIMKVLGTINAGIEIETLKKQGMHPAQALKSYEPFKTNFNKLYNSSGNYTLFMMPGLMGAIMQQIIFLGLALVFARDFEDGYFNTLIQKSKWSSYHVLLKMTPFVLLTTIVWAAVACFVPYFNIEVDVFTGPMLLLVVLLSLAAMAIGMLFSIAIPNQLKATELLMVISTPAFVLSGFTWPISAMPLFIQNIAQIIPLTHFLEGFKKIAIYGGSYSDIKQELHSLFVIALIGFISIIVLLQMKINIQEQKNTIKTQN